MKLELELIGNASDILREYVNGDFEVVRFEDKIAFVHMETGEAYDLPEDVIYYLETILYT